jgi:hypothetical protein
MMKFIKAVIILCLFLGLISTISYGGKSVESSQWKSFDGTAAAESTFSFPQLVITIKPYSHSASPFKEDNLTMVIKKQDGTVIEHEFVSSYGSCSIFVKSGYLFLEYGIGRGPGVREEHIKAYTLGAQYEYIKELVEVFDVQKSYRFPNPEPVAYPAYVEYKVRVVEDKDDLKVILYDAQKGFGVPERKEIILKKYSK